MFDIADVKVYAERQLRVQLLEQGVKPWKIQAKITLQVVRIKLNLVDTVFKVVVKTAQRAKQPP